MNRSTEDDSSPGEDWIIATGIPKHGLIVRIQGTLGSDGTGWNGGKYENGQGLVTSITIASAGKASYVSIRLRAESEGTSVDIPHKYVKPVTPKYTGQGVIVVSGKDLGTIGTVREIDQDSNICTIELAAKGVMDSFDCNTLTLFEGELHS